ncbi:formate dehydrogenase accessory sulfurtransferase FdhD [Natronospirillum operosum]|uniref:Sulfur carrier protein FdhD n=1 Tax=Natronospirillum operosum TaxID=2759953 RepID=A0A4Z0W552_9GAMM|nr:formate dehydrogenase accessory sulfurtransferase FdhD [Natronospirillum operosum]TGG91987.1 formate dehydrogenase accessory sulfurtransferase FdhD [Natronospirillum operosum]
MPEFAALTQAGRRPADEAGRPQSGLQSVAARERLGEREQVLQDEVAEECPVALSYNGISHAVMMATPLDLEDLARGFSLSEGIVDGVADIFAIDVSGDVDNGFTLDLHIHGARLDRLKRQHRHMAGPTGCGLCGKDSLQAVMQPLSQLVPRGLPAAAAVEQALHNLPARQRIQQQTGACHAAAWCSAAGDIVLSREDVGRHNALDKLIGALMQGDDGPQRDLDGFVLVSSRASYELAYKCVRAGLPSLVAVSGATQLAIQTAARNHLNLLAFARPGRQVVYHAAAGGTSS